jgi:dihydrofolate reductase
MIVSLIVAMDERGGIGLNNQVPWHIPADLKRFKALTMGHHLIVGRKTFASIGKALPGRTMIIVSHSKDYRAEGCLIVPSLPRALHLAEERGETEAFIGGGGSIYAQALPVADRIYLTRVHVEVDADVYFPAWDEKEWRIVFQEELVAAGGEGPACSFTVYERGNICSIVVTT